MAEPLVEVDGLRKHYARRGFLDHVPGYEPEVVRAVDGVSFRIERGETLGLVGESGCGKSTTGETMLRLSEPTAGRVSFEGDDVYAMGSRALKQFRSRAQIVFQDPFSSLNPRMTVGQIVREPLDIHGRGEPADREDRARELLEDVDLSGKHVNRYPSEFSGGQRQRIAIARALALEPEFVVLDEPVSGLDVSIQAQVLNLLRDLQSELDLTFLFISHDLGVVRHVCDRVAVMYLGELVEVGPVEEIFADPAHPYTRALLASITRPDLAERNREFEVLSGNVPSPQNPPAGCRFHTRCPEAREACREAVPGFETDAGRRAACFRRDDQHEYWDSRPLDGGADPA